MDVKAPRHRSRILKSYRQRVSIEAVLPLLIILGRGHWKTSTAPRIRQSSIYALCVSSWFDNPVSWLRYIDYAFREVGTFGIVTFLMLSSATVEILPQELH